MLPPNDGDGNSQEPTGKQGDVNAVLLTYHLDAQQVTLSVNPLNGLLRTLNRKPKMKEDYF